MAKKQHTKVPKRNKALEDAEYDLTQKIGQVRGIVIQMSEVAGIDDHWMLALQGVAAMLDETDNLADKFATAACDAAAGRSGAAGGAR